jgi:hypothetical protein
MLTSLQVEVSPRDIMYTLDAQSATDTEPQVLITTDLRCGGVQWGDDNLALVYERCVRVARASCPSGRFCCWSASGVARSYRSARVGVSEADPPNRQPVQVLASERITSIHPQGLYELKIIGSRCLLTDVTGVARVQLVQDAAVSDPTIRAGLARLAIAGTPRLHPCCRAGMHARPTLESVGVIWWRGLRGDLQCRCF